MVGGIITIVIGVLMLIAGPIVGVTISRRERSGRSRSGKITGTSAAVLGIFIIIYGIYLVATNPG